MTTATHFDNFHDLAARLADGCVSTTLRFIGDMLELDNLPPEAAAVRDGLPITPAFWTWLDDCRRFGTEPAELVEIFDRREFEALADAVAAFSRAAGCFGGYAPEAFGELFSLPLEQSGPDAVLELAGRANKAAQLRREAELGDWDGPDYNSPAELEITDTRSDGGHGLVRVLWGTGTTLATLELEFDDEGNAGTWSVALGVSTNKWAKRPAVNSGHDWSARSPLRSLATRLAARDADLTEQAAG